MAKTKDEVIQRIETFLKMEFPQIEMHGGDFIIESYDHDEGYAVVNLTDACDGCGISPMTVEAIKKRMPKSIDEINRVDAMTGGEKEAPVTDGPF